MAGRPAGHHHGGDSAIGAASSCRRNRTGEGVRGLSTGDDPATSVPAWSRTCWPAAVNAGRLGGRRGLAAYNAGIGYIGRANEKIEPGVHAGADITAAVGRRPRASRPFAELGQQGRRYVSDVVTPR